MHLLQGPISGERETLTSLLSTTPFLQPTLRSDSSPTSPHADLPTLTLSPTDALARQDPLFLTQTSRAHLFSRGPPSSALASLRSRAAPRPLPTRALRTNGAHSTQPTPSDTAPSPQPLPHRPGPSLTRLPALAQPNLPAATPDSGPIKAQLLFGATNQRRARTGCGSDRHRLSLPLQPPLQPPFRLQPRLALSSGSQPVCIAPLLPVPELAAPAL
ncbi:unnamed protein product, partial [Rangifer tarandus platyrhynchus]